MKIFIYTIIALSTISCFGCRDTPTPESILFMRDSTPPVLVSWSMENESWATLRYNEQLKAAYLDRDNDNRLWVSGNLVTVKFNTPQESGTPVQIRLRVKDKAGNSSRNKIVLWPRPATPARVMITEFSTKGTSTQPDRVELKVVKSGDMAGIWLGTGFPGFAKDYFIFPHREVVEGEYLVVHFRKGKKPARYLSENLSGLANSTGALVVLDTPSPESEILDGATYSTGAINKEIEKLIKDEKWRGRPLNPDGCSSTRTFNRYGEDDSDSADDWYICDTGHASFGEANHSEVYIRDR